MRNRIESALLWVQAKWYRIAVAESTVVALWLGIYFRTGHILDLVVTLFVAVVGTALALGSWVIERREKVREQIEAIEQTMGQTDGHWIGPEDPSYPRRPKR